MFSIRSTYNTYAIPIAIKKKTPVIRTVVVLLYERFRHSSELRHRVGH